MNEPIAMATLVILGITTLVSYRAFSNRELLDALIFSPIHILRDKEYRRLITSALIHADWMHLLFNMFSLYSRALAGGLDGFQGQLRPGEGM